MHSKNPRSNFWESTGGTDEVIVTRFNSDGRLAVPESEAGILLADLDKKRLPKGPPT